ncbi:MAG: GHMP kinase [Metallosphaera sp.]|uniref:GHMP family kinase ATP-binding protein n=1 Tax=Metallosphaera sp. TaxID=2020860 RepID=UPI003168A00D
MVDVLIPLSVSGVWYPYLAEDLAQSGSIGITVLLEPFSYAKVRNGEGILINGEKVRLDNVEYLSRKLGKVKVEIETGVPLGYGYGLSASISLAYALGVSEIKGIDPYLAVLEAHKSEIIAKNGLGDIVSQYFGKNIVYREKPGFPPYGVVRSFPIDSDNIYSLPIESLPTTTILKPLDVSFELIQDFLQNPTLERFFSVSKRFTELLGFESKYPNSFRKKGLILKFGEPESGSWIRHRIAKRGAYVE